MNLWIAAKLGRLDRVQYWLNEATPRALVDAKSNYGYTALHLAVLYNQPHVVQYLVHDAHANVHLGYQFASPNASGSSILPLLSFVTAADMARLLLQLSASLPTPLARPPERVLKTMPAEVRRLLSATE